MWCHTDFGKFHPAQNKNPPCTFIDFITKLSLFLKNLMTIFLTVLLSYKSLFYLKNCGDKSSWLFNFCTPTRLFQPPQLLERWEYSFLCSFFQGMMKMKLHFEFYWKCDFRIFWTPLCKQCCSPVITSPVADKNEIACFRPVKMPRLGIEHHRRYKVVVCQLFFVK